MRFFKLILVVFVGVALVCVVNTLRVPKALPDGVRVDEPGVDVAKVAAHLAEAVRWKTVSHQDPAQVDEAQLAGLRGLLEQTYPRVHAQLSHELVNGQALLFTWKGQDPALAPLILLAHQDVVPIEPGTEGKWTHPPFAGELADGFVWGRGAVDDKGELVAIFEAVELLLSKNFAPRRTVLLALGHDEEVSGSRGALALVRLLRERGVHPALVLDEGMVVSEGLVPGVERPVALLGLAEKGYLTIELSTTGKGGHSSMPPPHTAAGVIAQAVERLEARPLPTRFTPTVRAGLAGLAPELPFGKRLAMANLWLLEPLVRGLYAANPSSNALVRTTCAVTMLEGSVKENVLPQRARAVVNFRILPGDTIAGVLAHVTAAVDDERVEVKSIGSMQSEASAQTPATGPGVQAIERTIREVFPRAVTMPSIMLGAADARHYAELGGETVRFMPFVFRPGDPERLHGTDERVRIDELGDAVRFHARLIRNFAGQ